MNFVVGKFSKLALFSDPINNNSYMSLNLEWCRTCDVLTPHNVECAILPTSPLTPQECSGRGAEGAEVDYQRSEDVIRLFQSTQHSTEQQYAVLHCTGFIRYCIVLLWALLYWVCTLLY